MRSRAISRSLARVILCETCVYCVYFELLCRMLIAHQLRSRERLKKPGGGSDDRVKVVVERLIAANGNMCVKNAKTTDRLQSDVKKEQRLAGD